MRSKLLALIIPILAVFACQKSNSTNTNTNTPPVTVPPPKADTLLSWSVIDSMPGESILDIWFTSATHGIALGHKIYQTNDGGMGWAEIPNTTGVIDFYNLFFVNAQFGFAQGISKLATTVDGGNSWTVKGAPWLGGQSIFFADSSVGFEGDPSGLRRTINAGNIWSISYNAPGTNQDYYPYFFNEDTGYVATGAGTFLATTDGGNTWQPRATNLPANQQAQSYNQLFFINQSVGFYACPSGVVKTIDGGQSWQNVLSYKINDTIVSTVNVVRFADANTGYYKGLYAIYKTSDGGQTWSLSCKLALDQLMGMTILDAHTGWACTDKGRILRIQ